MFFPDRHFRLTAWLAAALVAMYVFWPVLAQARPATVPSLLVCTAQGLRSLPDPAAPAHPAGAFESQLHCALCTPGGEASWLAQTSDLPYAFSDEPAATIPAAATAAVYSGVYRSPPSHAPPAAT